MGIAIRLLVVVIGGAGLGVLSALWSFGAIGAERSNYQIDVGGWTGSTMIGSEASDPYTRARIARRGLLAMARSEAIYFFRDRDQSGRRLREDCTYRMEGSSLPARWWSVTLYAEDDYLAQNDDDAHSVSAATPGITADGWAATISPDLPDGPWISTREAGRFSLTIRLYNPSQRLKAEPDTFEFPSVRRTGCKEDGDENA